MTEKTKAKNPSTYTNAKFAQENEEFKRACEAIDLKPTMRQASKWRRRTGKAYKAKNNISM